METKTNKMKDNKLTSMVEYVIELDSRFGEHSTERFSRLYYKKIVRCAQFHSQPLTLGDFVPCVDGVPMDEPNENSTVYLDDMNRNYNTFLLAEDKLKFQKAKSRVLFEGFVMYSNMANVVLDCNSLETIDLSEHSDIESIVDFQPTLTETALKQIK